MKMRIAFADHVFTATLYDSPPARDLCYYAPWGNLAFFYAGYRYSAGLIRLGRLDGGVEPLLTRGKFPLRIERLS
ncbi:hypothetical protein CN234_06035 [Sinorhizobium meliloti]|nr:hypothetical protein CN234_06035 [Sinorhizobium meliloti]